MTPNDDLSRWGEPPASDQELQQAERLAELLDLRAERPAGREGGDLLEVDSWLHMLVASVISHAGVRESLAEAFGPAVGVDLRLRVFRGLTNGGFLLVGATQPTRATLRDFKRLPDDADRVVMKTGDRARIDVLCDRDGYLTVFNIGPSGNLNLLWPAEFNTVRPYRAGETLQVVNVVLTPPAGRERVVAVWSRAPLSREAMSELGRPGVATRDMQRVQSAVDAMRPEDWHAVMVTVEHEGHRE